MLFHRYISLFFFEKGEEKKRKKKKPSHRGSGSTRRSFNVQRTEFV